MFTKLFEPVITISVDEKVYSTKASTNEKWQVTVATPTAGGSYVFAFSDDEALRIDNVPVGKVGSFQQWVVPGLKAGLASPARTYGPYFQFGYGGHEERGGGRTHLLH